MRKMALKLILITGFLIISCSSDNSNNEEQINNSPEIIVTTSDFSLTIEENPDANQILGIIQGITNDGSVTFSILNESPNGAFSINSSTGQLTVSNESLFDFETNPIINATIKVENESVFETSNVTINLTDIEEDNIYIGDVHLFSQQEIENFGQNQYTEITGILRLVDSSYNITSLNPLSSLKKVGTLNLNYCPNLSNLNGLNNLIEIENDLIIENCHILTNINELNNLEIIGNSILLYGNNLLTSLDGLINITEIGGYLSIYVNESITNLNGLDNLTIINDFLKIAGNRSLTDIDSLSNLSSVLGSVLISSNNIISSLNGLENLTSIGGFLNITHNWELTDFCGIAPLFNNNGLTDTYTVNNNSFNPTEEDILNGNCSQ